MKSLLSIFFSVIFGAAAWAHGDGDWIKRDELGQKSSWCCGVDDCVVQPAGAVERNMNGGYTVVATGQYFAEVGEQIDGDSADQRTYYSINEHYWICWYPLSPNNLNKFTIPPGINVPAGHVPKGRCLFVPSTGT